MIAPHQLEQITAIGGSEGISSGLRTVVSAGLLALQSDMALLQPVEDLMVLADRLATITGRKTPAGAWWAPTREALPPTDELDPHGAVIVTPWAVGLLGDGCLVVDLEAGQISANIGGHEVNASIDLNELVGPAVLLPASIAGLAMAGPGRRDLGHGLTAERTADDLFRVSLQNIGARCCPSAAQTFAAELLGLVTRATHRSAMAREQLNRVLEVTP
jgi:hypothetical protein